MNPEKILTALYELWGEQNGIELDIQIKKEINNEQTQK